MKTLKITEDLCDKNQTNDSKCSNLSVNPSRKGLGKLCSSRLDGSFCFFFQSQFLKVFSGFVYHSFFNTLDSSTI